jgi:hypothetical protein
MKTSELTGYALDWAVAKCLGVTPMLAHNHTMTGLVVLDAELIDMETDDCEEPLNFSTDWARGGPIIEREWIELGAYADTWQATMHLEDGSIYRRGPNPLIAAMRCYVASQLGDDVEVPKP